MITVSAPASPRSTMHPSPAPTGFGAALDAALAELEGPDRLRVWSVVVSLFGDAVLPRGGVLRLSAIQEVTDRLGLEAGALRTAMSRLARDGWLIRDRRGRASYYRFTPERRGESERAARRIYAAGPPEWSGGWTVAVLRPADAQTRDEQGEALRAQGFGQAATETWLRPGGTAGAPELPDGASCFDVPAGAAEVAEETLAAAWPDEEAARRFRTTLAVVAPMAAALDAGATAAPLDALAARVLALHQWRRAALKATDLPAALRPADWPGEIARAHVRALYWRLADPSEAWLDACEGAPEGRLRPADPDLSARFGGPPAAAPR